MCCFVLFCTIFFCPIVLVSIPFFSALAVIQPLILHANSLSAWQVRHFVYFNIVFFHVLLFIFLTGNIPPTIHSNSSTAPQVTIVCSVLWFRVLCRSVPFYRVMRSIVLAATATGGTVEDVMIFNILFCSTVIFC